ncbi:MAG: chemotaxis protein CheW [Colwellia sp.]
MSFEVDEEILQDFLVEAGEILESLSEELVELENDGDNEELLNSIFRGFHTIKGGAGFLSLTELVDVCHWAENIFDLLRRNKRQVDAELMDTILQALDTINAMFELVQNREPLIKAEDNLLAELEKLSVPESAQEEIQEGAPEVSTAMADEMPSSLETSSSEITDESSANSDTSDETYSSNSALDEMTQDEFESLLDELHGTKQPEVSEHNNSSPPDVTPNDSATENGDISEDEFESLLDNIHGEGKFDATEQTATAVKKEAEPLVEQASETENQSEEDMLEDHFESLLDELHGKGEAPSSANKSDTLTNTEPVKKPEVVLNNVSTNTEETKVSSGTASQPTKPVVNKTEKDPSAKKASTPAPKAESTVRVDTRRLDEIMNMVGELVLVRNRLTSLGVVTGDETLSKAVTNLDAVTTDLQGAVMKTRMQPIKKVFGRFPRVVRDLARSLEKEIKLILEGEETDLDKNLVEALADPLVHLVRNSVDHGIELPSDREQAGKEKEGVIILKASQEGDHILLTIKDDGAGMDAEKLKSIAVDKGVIDIDAADKMPDKEAFNLIFAPGFSTKTEISEVSGRGVGMDVVKTKISQLNGSINIDSEIGKGTVLEIKVPLTLAILPTLMVNVGTQIFALPLASVNEIFHLDLNETNKVDGQLTIIVRNKAIPLFYLDKWLSAQPHTDALVDKGHVVLMQLGEKQVAFVVDSLIGQEEVVIKPLDNLLHGTPGMSGATITSDGGIALIVDIPNLLKFHGKNII